jgi:hypothetical protein
MGGGGKSGGSSQQYNYYGTLAGGVCIGPNEDLVAIILNGQETWPQGTPWAADITYDSAVLYVFDAQTWVCPSALNGVVATDANAPGTTGWVEYTFTRTSEAYDDFSLTASDGTYYGVMRFYWGTNAQTVDPLLESTGNDGGVNGNIGFGDQHPDYQGLTYVVVMDFLLGQEVQSGPNIEIVTRRKPNQSVITGAAAGITDGQANLAAVAAELLLDENCLGLDPDSIDATSFQAVADWLQTYQDKYGASVLIDSSESITSIFDKLTQMIDGYIRFNPTTKKVELGVYQHGVVPTSYTTLTEDSLTKYPKFNSKSWQETISRATVRYNDRQLNYQQTSVQVDDPRAFFVLGTVREQSLDRPWIARAAQAMIHGRETLRVIGHAQMTGELEVRREIGRNIRAGDYVLVDIDLEPDANTLYQFFRVTQKKMPPTGPVTLSVFADNTLAPVPWNNPSTPVTVAEPVVPPITNFRFLSVPTILAGQRGAIVALAERPNNLIVGSTLYFDTSSTGTFNSLGIFSNFAAKGLLHADIAAGDTALVVDIDTTQVDADYFTQQLSDIQKANDEMLAFIVQVVPSGGDAGQVAESGGYQIMEICSVGAQTLVSAGRYSLAVLRGRQNTSALAFTAANSEVWLIPRALITPFIHANFATIAANRVQGLTPDHAQFRLCPFTFVSSLALSAATSELFRFPLNSQSALSLTLTAPTSYALTYASPTYPVSIPISGTYSDPDGNLTGIQVLLRLSTESSDREIINQTFAPRANQSFATNVQIEQAGSYIIKIIGRDSTNFTTEQDITVSVIGSGAKCAMPVIFDLDGNPIEGTLAGPVQVQSKDLGALTPYITQLGFFWTLTPTSYIPFGALALKCSTPGATIRFCTQGCVLSAGAISVPGYSGIPYDIFTYVAGNVIPFNSLLSTPTTSPPTGFYLTAYATAPGFADSDGLLVKIVQFE